MKKLSIGMRLTLWYFAIFLLAEFAFGAGMWLILRKNLFDIADEVCRARLLTCGDSWKRERMCLRRSCRQRSAKTTRSNGQQTICKSVMPAATQSMVPGFSKSIRSPRSHRIS